MDGVEPHSEASKELRQALAALAVEDILALCYRFRGRVDRLRLYLDVLRQRGGPRAALAAALICYDLAEQGQVTAQREFEALAETLRAFDARDSAAAELIADSPYLGELWPRCEAALQGLDPRLGVDASLQIDVEPIEIDLFEEGEIEDLEDFIAEDFDPAEMWRRYDRLVTRFFYPGPDAPVSMDYRGFYAETRGDLYRIETYIRELYSLLDFVPAARSMLAVSELFLATHLRTKTFWGRPNPRRTELVASGLRHFMLCDGNIAFAVGYLSGNDAEPEAWPKIALLLLDFLAWVDQEWQAELTAAPNFYAEEARELPRVRDFDRRATNRGGARRVLNLLRT